MAPLCVLVLSRLSLCCVRNILASRGGKRAQKTPNTTKSRGAEIQGSSIMHPSTICCGTCGSVLVAPRRGYWGLSGVGGIGDWGFFYSAPQDFVVLGVWCLLRALPSSREASYFSDFILSFAKNL